MFSTSLCNFVTTRRATAGSKRRRSAVYDLRELRRFSSGVNFRKRSPQLLGEIVTHRQSFVGIAEQFCDGLNHGFADERSELTYGQVCNPGVRHRVVPFPS